MKPTVSKMKIFRVTEVKWVIDEILIYKVYSYLASMKDVIWFICSRGPRLHAGRTAGKDLTKSMHRWLNLRKKNIIAKHLEVVGIDTCPAQCML